MAVSTWTHKAVVDLFPDFLNQRRRGFLPQGQALASELGVGWISLAYLNQAVTIAQDGVVTLARHRWRSPYATKDPWTPAWNDNVSAGLATKAGGGWRIEQAGHAAVARLNGAARRYLAGLSLPAQETGRVRRALGELAAKIPADSERAMGQRRTAPSTEEAKADIVALEQAVLEVWSRRDDCHIGAWQAAGYEGPALDVLSQVWEGESTLDGVAKKVEAKQEREDVERNVDALIQRGDLAREGSGLRLTPRGQAARDAIEAETDRRYFAGWPEGEELARIGEDMRALIAALP